MWQRHLVGALRASLADTRVVFLTGARQVGKTTLVRDLLGDGGDGARPTYLTLDDGAVLHAARHDPAGLVAGLSGLTILDEIQRAPELLLVIKADVDRDPRPGRFLLTGSVNVLAMPRLADSLAGRMEVHTLWTLSQGELRGGREGFVDALFAPRGPRRLDMGSGDMGSGDMGGGGAAPSSGDEASLQEAMLTGGYPEVNRRTSARRRAAWFRSYVTTILQRDVRDLARVADLAAMPRLLALLAARSGSLLNLAALSRDAGIPRTSLERYVRLLEAVYLIRFLPAWARNPSKRLTRSPKVLLTDTGLLSSLLDLSPARLAGDLGGTLRGSLTETFAITEVLRQLGWAKTSVTPWHYRTHDGAEVDLVLEGPGGDVVGVEVKSTHSLGRRAVRGLESLRAAAGDRFLRGVVLYGGPDVKPLGAHLHAVPLRALWA